MGVFGKLMRVLGKLLLLDVLATVLLAVGIGIVWTRLQQPAPVPKLVPTYWGPGKARVDDVAVQPFKINVSKEVLDDLQNRLTLVSSLTPPLEGGNFRYGFNTAYLPKVVKFWQNDYDWRNREAFLNHVPHFKTQVAGLQIHFIHVKPTKVPAGTQVVPLMLLHGWPGSVREFYSLIPLLTMPHNGVDFVFEVIVPSLPGYGFSEGASKPGLGIAQTAVIMNTLMNRLGFNQFYVQGGDWGAAIAAALGTLYPESILGIHSNMCLVNTPLSVTKLIVGSFWPSLIVDQQHEHRIYPLSDKLSLLAEESGYLHIQASKPDTVGVALRDSPVGLAAYILEKFSTWTNPAWRSLDDGGLTTKFTLTELLDNVMIYWITGSITTSMRFYSETLNKAQSQLELDRVPCVVPMACAVFPNELTYSPESIMRDKFVNLVRFTHMPRGGHFAALEEPQLMADDIWGAFQNMRNKKV